MTRFTCNIKFIRYFIIYDIYLESGKNSSGILVFITCGNKFSSVPEYDQERKTVRKISSPVVDIQIIFNVSKNSLPNTDESILLKTQQFTEGRKRVKHLSLKQTKEGKK